jgi:hypothetical protein
MTPGPVIPNQVVRTEEVHGTLEVVYVKIIGILQTELPTDEIVCTLT